MSKTAKVILWIVVIVVIIALIAIFIPKKSKNESGPIKIGFVTPLSGPAGSLGEFMKNINDLALEEINKNGGVNGRQIEVIYEDDQCENAKSITAVKKLIDIDQVKIIISSTCSGGAIATIPVMEQAGVFSFSASATSPNLTNISKMFSRTVSSDAEQGNTLAQLAISKGWKKIGILTEQTDSSSGILNAFIENYGSFGTVVKEEFSAKTSDYRTLIIKIKAENPDAVFFIPQSPVTARTLFKNYEALNMHVPIMVNDITSGNADLLVENKKLLEGAFGAEQSPDLNNPKYFALEDTYQKKFGKGMEYKAYAEAQYDLMYILKAGLEKFGEDPEKISTWVRTIKDWDGASGKLTMKPNGDRVGGFVLKVIKNGVTELIK